ncbi:Ionotropic glutamate receptor [Trinorchestia longiramus]|nr:Ionotropic glutamate receptor [Trinorchestia longiramus]
MKLQLKACLGLMIFLTYSYMTNSVRNNASYATVVLRELLEGALRNTEVFVLDGSVSSEIDWGEVYPPDVTMTRITASNYNSAIFPSKVFLGSNFTVIWIIDNSEMNNVISHLPEECSRQLIVLSLNDNLEIWKIFQTKATYCSKFAVVIQCHELSNTASVYVNFPLKENSIKLLGMWSLETFRVKESLFLERFKTFSGSVLKVASLCDDFPLLYQINEDCSCRGSNLDALQVISSHLNFSFEYQINSSDFNWGSYENGTWTGLLADLVYNGRHIVINYFLLNLERYTYFDSTYPYRAEGFGFLAHLPTPLPQWKAVVLPFSLNTWISIGAAIIVVTIFFTLFSWIVINNERSATLQPITALFLVLGALLSQPSSLGAVDRAEWRRVWMAVWFLSCIVFVTAFKGNLIAFLTVPQYPLRIETLKQLAQSPLRVTMQDYGEFVPDALKASTDHTLHTIGNKLDLFPYKLNYDIGMDLVVANKTHALIETYSYLMSLQKKYNVTDHTYLLKEQVYSGHLSWLLPKHTPYTEVISDTLQRLRETGILHKLFHDHFGDTAARKDDIVSVSSLSMEQLQGAFFLLLVGFSAAFISWVLEVVSMRLKLRREARSF